MRLSIRQLLFIVIVLAAIAWVLSFGTHPFVSHELKFTDASAKGLAIVPASCPSTPHGGQVCSYTVPPTVPPICTDYLSNGSCGNPSCPVGYTLSGSNCVVVSCPSGYTLSGSTCTLTVDRSCTAQSFCQGNSLYYQNANCSASPSQTCSYGCAGSACLAAPSINIVTWSVRPSLVQNKATARIQWEAHNVSTCTVTGSNGDSWTANSGDQTSSQITSQTIYTLTCTGLPTATPSSVTRTATVNVVPQFQEP